MFYNTFQRYNDKKSFNTFQFYNYSRELTLRRSNQIITQKIKRCCNESDFIAYVRLWQL